MTEQSQSKPRKALNAARLDEALAASGPIILTVHGTNDADTVSEGERWWQRGSTFLAAVTGALERRGGSAAVVMPFHWSGENSDIARLDGAKQLAKSMQRLEKAKRPYHLVAHSHGGNVALLAITQQRRIGRKTEHLASVTSFGTPFFRRRLKPLSIAFAAYRGLLALILLITALFTIAMPPLSAGFAVLAFIAWRHFAPELWERRRLKRWFADEGGRKWRAIWATRDEAIGLLARARALKPAFVSPASIRRSLERMMLTVAALGAGGTTAAWYGGILESTFSEEERAALAGAAGSVAAPAIESILGSHATTIWIATPLALALFGLYYFVGAVIARAGPQIVLAAILNNGIRGGLTSGAFGEDSRFQLLGAGPLPEEASAILETRITREAIGHVDAEDAREAAQALYEDVIEFDEGDVNMTNPDGLWNSLNNALYHNAYFDDAAVIEIAAAHMAGERPQPTPVAAAPASSSAGLVRTPSDHDGPPLVVLAPILSNEAVWPQGGEPKSRETPDAVEPGAGSDSGSGAGSAAGSGAPSGGGGDSGGGESGGGDSGGG